MIMSPGCAWSIATWMALLVGFSPVTWVGGLPPTVTVTASIDCLPLAEVMTSSPHRVAVVTPRCCSVQVDCAALIFGTFTTI